MSPCRACSPWACPPLPDPGLRSPDRPLTLACPTLVTLTVGNIDQADLRLDCPALESLPNRDDTPDGFGAIRVACARHNVDFVIIFGFPIFPLAFPSQPRILDAAASPEMTAAQVLRRPNHINQSPTNPQIIRLSLVGF
ncbi:hypothetical protein PAPYR_3554 [Paratrimastix pyriformis]|uniref:Uncharacterized protein n=1 Tax=Paratrimastix pyriformis TaxID=342808 RepID=A0ABQ8ULW0_9EUKA|nr:hypothetical protein PAPYR_3554 [Paratrimastix pyriformis]